MVRSQNIPNGWTVTLLDSAAERCSGHTPSKSFSEYWNGGIKWISLADSFRLDNGYVYETDKEISQLGIDNSSAVIHPKGTVVLSRDAGVGKSGVMAEPMAVSQHFIAWKCDVNKKVHNWFLYNWLQFHKSTFERQAVGSTIKTIGLPFFKKLKIALPPYVEQRKIAQILLTWDKAIATTEKLIDASKQQKKALMQQLLTGKKRLIDPETGKAFEGEWEETTISSFLKESKVKSLRDDAEKRLTVRLHLKGVEKRTIRGTESVDSTAHFSRSSGQFIYGKQNIHKGAFGIIPESLHGYESSQDIPCFDFKDACIPMWFMHYLSQESIYKSLEHKMSGTGSKRLNPKMFFKVKLPLITLREQQKIASVLTAADKEIELLEAKLAHLKQEKKALMQQLLIGKRRVKVTETEAA
ncbi:restriction endonuclease subunit S [Vibrio lentus]